jgi:hypothetical protein
MSPAEYQAKRDWLRSNPTGVQARSLMRELRAWERELIEQGTTVEAWLATDRVRLGLTPWFVAYFYDRPGKPLGSRVRHHERYCTAIAEIPDEDVREATESEIKELPPCAWCG